MERREAGWVKDNAATIRVQQWVERNHATFFIFGTIKDQGPM